MNVIRKRLLAIIENYGNAMEEYGKLSSIGFILEAHKKLIETEKIEKEIKSIITGLCLCNADQVDECMFWDGDGFCTHQRDDETNCNTKDCRFYSSKAEQNCGGMNSCGNPAIESCTEYTPEEDKMIEPDEHLELDEVAGDFCDWYSERIHIFYVRQSKARCDAMILFNGFIIRNFEYNIKQLFGHDISFYRG